jgi:hypothetical protein
MAQVLATVRVLVLGPTWRGVEHEELQVLQRQFRWAQLDFIPHRETDAAGCAQAVRTFDANAIVAPRGLSSRDLAGELGRILVVDYLRGPSQVITW